MPFGFPGDMPSMRYDPIHPFVPNDHNKPGGMGFMWDWWIINKFINFRMLASLNTQINLLKL